MIGADRFVDSLPEASQIKHATQRYRDGISDIDMWNFDSFLADAIVAGCNWHIENAQTGPWHIDPDEWRQILTEIRDSFAKHDNIGVAQPSKRAWKLLRKNFRYFWD